MRVFLLMSSHYLKYLLIVGCILGLTAWLAGVPLLENLVETAYKGSSVGYLNKLVAKDRLKDPQTRTLTYYQERGARTFTRLVLLYFAGLAVAALALSYGRRQCTAFFAATTSPLNLAVFRMVLFGQLLLFSPKLAVNLSQLSQAALVPPPGWGWLLTILPLNPPLVETISRLFQLCCLAGLLGFFTRTAALGAAILGLYAMGLPQFFGKIDHYHHLWWFALLLAFSPAGHALSLDASRRAWSLDETAPARHYALPLRFVWLLIGLVYFFPGFWKFVLGGIDWALSDNIKFKMYAKWFELGGWEPFFRIDRYPLLYKAGGLYTLLFELGFLIALFYPLARIAFIVGGLVFYLNNALFLNIYFTHLIITYAAFVDWHRFFRWLGNRLFSQRAVLLYAPGTPAQRRAALIRSLDFFGAIHYQTDAKQSPKPLLRLTLGGAPTQGIGCWAALLARVPLALLVLPLLGIAGRGGAYAARADRVLPPVALRPLTLVGVLLLIANSLCGLALIDSWPFAVYPTFASTDKPQVPSMILMAADAQREPLAETVPLQNDHFKTAFDNPVRLRAYLNQLLASDPAQNPDGFKALWLLWRPTEKDLARARTVHFYQAMFSTFPEDQYGKYSDRQLVYTLSLDE